MSLYVVRAFVRLRRSLAQHADLARKLEALEKKYDAQFKVVFDAIRALMAAPEPRRRAIGFPRGGGQAGIPGAAAAQTIGGERLRRRPDHQRAGGCGRGAEPGPGPAGERERGRSASTESRVSSPDDHWDLASTRWGWRRKVGQMVKNQVAGASAADSVPRRNLPQICIQPDVKSTAYPKPAGCGSWG